MILESLILEFATRLRAAWPKGQAAWMSKFRTVNKHPEVTRGEQAKIELCVTRQIFDFQKLQDRTNPAGPTTTVEATAGMNGQI